MYVYVCKALQQKEFYKTTKTTTTSAYNSCNSYTKKKINKNYTKSALSFNTIKI